MRGLVHVLVAVMLAGSAAAQPLPEETPEKAERPLVVAADAPLPVWINGLEVALAVSTGTVDHVTLNDEAVHRIGLSASMPDNTADLIIGGRVVVQGRHGKGWLAQGGRLLRREYYWFPGQSRLPLAGTIGPFALPHWQVRVDWAVPATGPDAEVVQLPLMGGIDRAAYGIVRLRKQMMAVGVDVRMRRALPLVTAASGADLAAELGGRFVGEPWQEEIMMGVRRPVRRLELDRPLLIGPMRITALAVRQGGPRDATASLAPGQITPFDAEEDPEIMQVRGRIIKRRNVARYVMLTRTQLEAAGCHSLLVDKAAGLFSLSCAPPAQPVAVAAGPSTAVAVAAVAGPLIDPVLPQQPELAINLAEPVAVSIDGRPRRFLLGDAGAEGVRLNGDVAEAMVQVRLLQMASDARDRRRLADALRRATAERPLGEERMIMQTSDLALTGVTASEVMANTLLLGVELTLASARLRTQSMAFWLLHNGGRPDNSLPFDGRLSLSALPESRLRVGLGALAAGAATAAGLNLSIGDRSHDQAVMGVMALPGIDALFVGLEFGREVDLPVVSMALGQDLIRLHGAQPDGPQLRRRGGDYRLRLLRPLRLATPLVLGPLRLDRVLVEQAPGLTNWLDTIHWPRQRPWPDVARIAGLEREVRVPVAMLQAAGCGELVVDKPARRWTLMCTAD